MGRIVEIDPGSEEFLRCTGKKWVRKKIKEMARLKAEVNGRIQVPDYHIVSSQGPIYFGQIYICICIHTQSLLMCNPVLTTCSLSEYYKDYHILKRMTEIPNDLLGGAN